MASPDTTREVFAFMPGPAKSGSKLLCQLLAFLIAACLGMYWVVYASDPDVAILLFRPIIVAASVALALLFWFRVPVTYAEWKLAGVLAVLCGALLAPSINAADPVRALQEWLKLVVICAVSMMLSRALRYTSTAKIFGASLLTGSAVLGVFMAAAYVKHLGLALPTYAATRALKSVAQKENMPLNAIAFACMFSYICGMCLLRSTKFRWLLGLVLLAISSILTGSRAPAAALFGAGILMLVINATRSRRLLIWLTGWLLATALLVGVPVTIASLTSAQISEITEHRWDIWSVALQRFCERPILGYGYFSWYEALAEHVPGEHLTGGGYHNEFFTALAEQGLVGFLALMCLSCFLLRCCWKLTFRPSHTWHNGQWALFACLVLLLHAGVEVPGLLGYANEPADFLAYSFLAIVVSRLSVEEDYLRSVNRCLVRAPTAQAFESEGGGAAESIPA